MENLKRVAKAKSSKSFTKSTRAPSIAPLIMRHARASVSKRGSLERTACSADFSCAVSTHYFEESVGVTKKGTTKSRYNRKRRASTKRHSKNIGNAHRTAPRIARKAGTKKKKVSKNK